MTTLMSILGGVPAGRDPKRRPHRELRRLIKSEGSDEARTLYAYFREFNRAFFENRLGDPLILISPPPSPRAEGAYFKRDVHGIQSRIVIAPATMKRGMRAALACLLHEMVHAWCWEVLRDDEAGYKGHGPLFANTCNLIGRSLGFPECAPKGRGGKARAETWPDLPPVDGEEQKPARKKPEKAPSAGPGEHDDGGDPDGGHRDPVRGLADILASIDKAVGKERALVVDYLRDYADCMRSEGKKATAKTLGEIADEIERAAHHEAAACDGDPSEE